MDVRKLIKSTRKYHGSVEAIGNEAEGFYAVSAIDTNGTVRLFIEGMEHPENGYVLAEDLPFINAWKRMVMEMLRQLSNPLIWPFAFGIMISRKRLNRTVESFNSISSKLLRHTIVKDQHMTPFGMGLKSALFVMLRRMGIDSAYELAENASNVIDYDNAYRYRIQDLMAATTKDTLSSRPIREIIRLAYINQSRERQHGAMVSSKFRLASLAVAVMLCHPRIRRALREALESCDWDSMLPDEADRFWMCVRSGYDFYGMPDDERRRRINHLRVTKPRKAKK